MCLGGERQGFGLKSSYHNVLREEIVAEGAVIKVDLVKRLFGKLDHITLVVTAIFVLTDDFLAHTEFSHGFFVPLRVKEIIFNQINLAPVSYIPAQALAHITLRKNTLLLFLVRE